MRAGVAVCPTQKNANGKNKVCVNEGQIKMASVPAPRPRPSIDLVIPVRMLVQFLPVSPAGVPGTGPTGLQGVVNKLRARAPELS